MTGNHNTLFPSAAFVGFDHLFTELDHLTRHAKDHYPPHNILKVGETDYLIEIAIAGFAREDISIEVKDRTLTVIGSSESKQRDYIHRGISTKNFKRSFRLSEHVQVTGADLVDGILSIDLKYEVPEEMRPRRIEIGHYEGKNDTHSTSNKTLLTEN